MSAHSLLETPEMAPHLAASFNDQAHIDVPPSVLERRARCCSPTAHDMQRRRWAAALAGVPFYAALGGCATPTRALAQQRQAAEQDTRGVDVGGNSAFTGLVPAEQVEAAAAQEYEKIKRQAASQNALAPANHPQMQRLRYIAQRLIPQGSAWNRRSSQWRWEVILVGSPELNAFCMPGGKICFFHGILSKLKLSDSEVATIMGHEMAHALREHSREQMGKQAATSAGINLLSQVFGLGQAGNTLLGLGGQLLSLRFSRDDEKDADLVGLEVSARSGYQPQAAVQLWQKMISAGNGGGVAFLSTHPSGPDRIRSLEGAIPKVQGLFSRAAKPDRQFPIAT